MSDLSSVDPITIALLMIALIFIAVFGIEVTM